MTAPEVVVVAGPPRAGVSAMVSELSRRLPSYRFAERTELSSDDSPAAVVFVVSAVAPLTESDCALPEFAADIDVVVAVVAKIDDHRDWQAVLSVNRAALGRPVPWVGAAAAPRLGEPIMDELVGVLDSALGDATVRARNTLLANDFRVAQLRNQRERLMRSRRLAAAERARTLRGAVQQVRLDLTHTVRRRCAALRTELVEKAAAVDRGEVGSFPRYVRQRCRDVLADVDADISAHAGATAAAPPPDLEPADPPLTPRRLENRLMAVLGAGFGFGVALVVTRVVAGLAPGLALAGLAVGGGVGLATSVWVIRARTLLHVRTLLQAWAAEVAAAARAAAEERVATRMLAAETSMALASATAGAGEDEEFGDQIAAIEAKIRQLTRSEEASGLLPIGRSPGYRHLNRSCE
ncbi:hypothetical protein [Mycobacterium sp. 236(2023)]|uniref:hypothetical protein n=1 Tax=Mycobacterium sp. 236(2023) TaxID=3038163 RepID=UPI002415000B|nr:hypothetical protein [Mycobacterium sp. 236(2023)]MDG4663026.1 hypothetical protein [Mycobacterium sp. 236(2023)]